MTRLTFCRIRERALPSLRGDEGSSSEMLGSLRPGSVIFSCWWPPRREKSTSQRHPNGRRISFATWANSRWMLLPRGLLKADDLDVRPKHRLQQRENGVRVTLIFVCILVDQLVTDVDENLVEISERKLRE